MVDYHDISAVSQSFLKAFDADPVKAVGQYIDRNIPREPPTAAMRFGILVEQYLWGDSLVAIPNDVLTSNGQRRGKAWEQFCEENDGKTFVKAEEVDVLWRIRTNLEHHAEAHSICFSEDGSTWTRCMWALSDGVTAKAELDRLSVTAGGHAVIGDLKTANANSPEDFARAAVKFGYHRQAAWYQDAVEQLTGDRLPVVFVVVKSSESYSVETYELDAEFVELGREMNRRSLERYLNCREQGTFNTPTHGTIVTLAAPRWVKYQDEYATA